MQIISIVGSTAVGKSAAALAVAEMLLTDNQSENLFTGVDIISADSRQVYQGLEILSGADQSDDWESVASGAAFKYDYFRLSNQPLFLHGTAIIKPNEDWSLAHFHQLAHEVIAEAIPARHAVIIVGGTGLYQTQLLQPELEQNSPPLPAVREKAEGLSVAELQQWLASLEENALAQLNQSDRANPRRLVRAIEKSIGKQSVQENVGLRVHPITNSMQAIGNPNSANQLSMESEHTQTFFGLQTNKVELAQRICQRVEQRLEQGAVSEATLLEARLEELGLPVARVPAYSACGLREVLAFARNELDREQCIELWTKREVAYARRQETWWKKYSQVQWFDITVTNWQARLLTAVQAQISR